MCEPDHVPRPLLLALTPSEAALLCRSVKPAFVARSQHAALSMTTVGCLGVADLSGF